MQHHCGIVLECNCDPGHIPGSTTDSSFPAARAGTGLSFPENMAPTESAEGSHPVSPKDLGVTEEGNPGGQVPGKCQAPNRGELLGMGLLAPQGCHLRGEKGMQSFLTKL